MIKLEDVFTYKNLEKSYFHCRKGKTFRAATVKYHMDYPARLLKLQKEILSGKYKIRGLYSFVIYEPKKRYITATHFEDKIVQRLISKLVLEPAIQPKLIYDNYASQPKKGTTLALDRAEKFMRAYVKECDYDPSGSIMIGDIKKFFYTIDKRICCSQVERLDIDADLKTMIYQQIYAYTAIYNEYTDDPNKGLCIGFEPSQWLAVYYLNGMDHFIKEQLGIHYYGRYMDDFYLIHSDSHYLKKCFNEIEHYVDSQLELELNKKSHIHPFSEGLCFLGYRMTFNSRTRQIDTVIRSKSINRMLKRLKGHRDLLVVSKMTREQAELSLESWHSYTERGKSEKAENAYDKARAIIDTSASIAELDYDHEYISDFADIFEESNYQCLLDLSSSSRANTKKQQLLSRMNLSLIMDSI